MDVLSASNSDNKIAWYEHIQDATAPAAPTGLAANTELTNIILTWNANSESDLDHYNIYGDTSPSPTTLVATVSSGTETYTHALLNGGQTYYYRISASDASYNESDPPGDVSATVSSNYTLVPDDNFEQALINLGYDDTLDDHVLTGNISGVTSLEINGEGISDLTGIEDFTALTGLIAPGNQLTSLDVSSNTTLFELILSGNQLTSLDLSSNTSLEILVIDSNQLTSLDVSNNTELIVLILSGNQLTSLDLSSNTGLIEVRLADNQLTTLDLSANTALTTLNCEYNQLIHLNMKNGVTNQLIEFIATDNSFDCIEVNAEDVDWATENWTSGNGNIDEGVVFEVICVPEGYTYVPDNNFEQALVDLGYDDVLNDFVLTANISGVTSLEVFAKEISDLTGIEGFTTLTYLNCNSNSLISLDVSSNTALTSLWVGENSLTSLDVSSNTALTTLSCDQNQLTSLDVTNNTALTGLWCYNNELTSLDVGSNTALEFLDCAENELTTLDVSNNTALTFLSCIENQLIYLNMKNGVTDALTFYATGNSLDCIEVNEEDVDWATENWTYENGNIDIEVEFSVVCVPEGYTYVPDNNFEQALVDLGYDDVLNDFVLIENIADLDSLDVSEKEINDLTGIEAFTTLTYLDCSSNSLTSLDVSANTALTLLACDNNQLTSLDVSANTALTGLYCGNNQLIYLNMKNGVTDALTFYATGNSLTCIEVNEEDVDYATENWTYENGNIDEDVSFTVCCMVSEDCLAPQAVFDLSEMYMAAVPGSETQLNIVLANGGDLALDYTVTVDATSTVYTWLSTTVESGQVPAGSTVSIPVTLDQTDNMSAGTYTGYLYFGTNTGADPGVIVSNTDTVSVTLNLMSDGTQFADTTVTVAAGNSEPINFTDESGQSTGITVDFEHSDGGSVMVQSIGLQPPMDETPLWVDPGGRLTDHAFPTKYFEISTDITGDYWVDIGLDYTMLVGIDDPQSLRLAKRPGYAGASEPWTVIAVASTEINSTDGLVVAKSQTSFSQWAMISNTSDNSFIDTDGPVISNFALTPAQPNILEEVTVTADLADGTGIAAATLYYMAGGGSGYTSVEMATTGGSYSGTIPGSAVSMAGLFYYMVAIDLSESSYTTSSDTIGIPVNFAAGSLTTSSATGSAYPSGLPLDKWRLISIPAVLDETGVGLVIGDELGTQDDNIWRMFDYDKSTSSYKANPVDFTVGESYWLYQRVEDNLTVSTPAGETGNMSGTTLTIAPGWNFIGSPYPFSLPLALDQVQFYGPITYGLTGQSWSSIVPELDPWNGYAVYNRTVSDKTIVLDPGSAGAGLAARVTNNENGWLIQMSAASGIYEDSHNIFGQLESASNDLDWHDNPELLSPGNYLSVAFNMLHENSTIALTSDLRELSENVQIWDGEISGLGLTDPVELSWNVEKAPPGDIAVNMIDLNTRSVLDLAAPDQYLLGDLDDRYSRQVKIVAGDPEQVALAVDDILATIPEELSLEGNYPNPFNPVTTIRFGLPEPRKIRITVINILGQEITELVNGWRDMGRHEVVWQGVDGSGKPVATGMYFTVLSDGNKIIVQKMLLLK